MIRRARICSSRRRTRRRSRRGPSRSRTSRATCRICASRGRCRSLLAVTSDWHAIANSPARLAYERIERDGVAVLCMTLAGHAENTPDGVARIKAALDAVGAATDPDVDVATLDVTEFSNASDDASGILTGVFGG